MNAYLQSQCLEITAAGSNITTIHISITFINILIMYTPTKSPFTLPKINLNGTSAEDLFDEYIDAQHAVRKALHILQECTCHGRDFQCNSSDDYNQALFERAENLAKLDDVLDYCQAWIDNANEAMEQ